MLGALGSYSSPETPLDSGPLDLYLHGSSVARLTKLSDPSKNPDLANDEEAGFPLAVAATHIDGFVLALSPFHHSTNYRSAVVHGYGSLVTDHDERLYAMGLITNSIVPGRWENSRQPPLKSELTATGILKVRIVSASAKVRTGMTNEERKDLKDESVVAGVWAGVVPCWTQRGEPVPTKENGVKEVPGYLKEWIERENEDGKGYAEKALAEQKKKKQ